MIKNLLEGFISILKAAKLMCRNRSLFKLALLPTLINMIVLAGIITSFFALYPKILSWLLTDPEKWWQYVLYYASAAGLTIALVFFSALVFVIIANIIASPLNEAIAAKTLEILGTEFPGPVTSPGFWGFIKHIENLTVTEAKKTLLIGLISVFSFVLGLMPVLNIISFIISAFLIGFAFFDYSLELTGYSFREKIKFTLKNSAKVLGLGLSTGILLAIPLINLIILPLAVSGGAFIIAGYVTNPKSSQGIDKPGQPGV